MFKTLLVGGLIEGESMTDKDIMPLSFFKYKGVFTGQNEGMRYLIKKSDREIEEETVSVLFVAAWPGPYRYDAVKPSLHLTNTFSLNDEGRLEAIAWLNKIYEEYPEKWNHDTSILNNDDKLIDINN